MAPRGLPRKTLFPPCLVSYLSYQLLFTFENILQAISKENKNLLKLLCWSVNKNCDVAIDRSGYQSKKQQEETTFPYLKM